ncbi:MAG: prephenate dehydrogenase/arogenate dehydrogenase family protein [Hyphomicrobiales bacterium]|nr:prephenate dehydrogenase/arogenate dehydrogenase family protein [Hyphomicrobiales bacterium]
MSTPVFEHVTIIGSGLIGSSLARAIRRSWPKNVHITGYDKDPKVRERARALGFWDNIDENPPSAVTDADLVLLCVPVGAMAEAGEAIGNHLKQGCVLSDTGSVKGSVMDALEPHVREGVAFVPAHPVAGTEESGPEAGFAELFDGSWCIFTPPAEADKLAISKLKIFWEKCGAKVTYMEAIEHDTILAATSHVPHLIAFGIVDMATKLEKVKEKDVIEFSAGGFKDFTRIAASDIIMWRDIFLNNQGVILETLDSFSEDIKRLRNAISHGDTGSIEETIRRAQGVRHKILEVDKNAKPVDSEKHKEEAQVNRRILEANEGVETIDPGKHEEEKAQVNFFDEYPLLFLDLESVHKKTIDVNPLQGMYTTSSDEQRKPASPVERNRKFVSP